MSYQPGRSRLLQGALAGAGAWVVGAAVTVLAMVFVLGIFETSQVGHAVVAYSMLVVWFVFVLAFGGGESALLFVIVGVASSFLLLVAGAIAVARVSSVAGPWDGLKVGATIGVGHALLTALAFSTFDPAFLGRQPALRTFALAFGGFVVPAILGAAGGVLQQQFQAR